MPKKSTLGLDENEHLCCEQPVGVTSLGTASNLELLSVITRQLLKGKPGNEDLRPTTARK